MKANKKSWKTTLVGACLAGLLTLKSLLVSGLVLDKEQILTLGVAVCIAALGAVAKDFDTTGVGNGK